MPKEGNYTGERLARERPKIYRRIVSLLALGKGTRAIMRECSVHNGTIAAVKRNEAVAIATRKQSLANISARVAQTAIEQIEDNLAHNKYSPQSLVPVFGVAVDKLLLLSGDPQLTIQHNHEVTGNIFHAFAKFHSDAIQILQQRQDNSDCNLPIIDATVDHS
jgi:hypothetical protein